MPRTLSPDPCNLKPPSERHYNSALSIWLSVDPMADKYPGMSPYVYCANNPVRLVDPDGRTIVPKDEDARQIYDDYKSVVNERLQKAHKSLSKLEQKSANGRRIREERIIQAQNKVRRYQEISDELKEMESSETVFVINAHTTGTSSSAYGSTTYNVKTNEVNINVGDGKAILNENGCYDYITPIMIIAHELKHGFQYLHSELDFDASGNFGGQFYDYTDEKDAIYRSSLFGFVDINSLEREYRLNLLQNRMQPRSYDLLTPAEKNKYNEEKANGKYH